MCLCVCTLFTLPMSGIVASRNAKAEKASQPTGLLLPSCFQLREEAAKGSPLRSNSTMWADSSLIPGGLAWSLFTPKSITALGPQPPALSLLPWKPYPEHLTCLYADYCWKADLQKPEFKPTLLPCTPVDCKDAQALTSLIETLEEATQGCFTFISHHLQCFCY